MAIYPARFVDDSGVERLVGELHYTDPVNQPLNAVLPVIVNAAALPVADPHVVGHLWNNAGTVKVSAG